MVKRGQDSGKDLLLENFINLQKKLAEAVKEMKDLDLKLNELLSIFKRAEQDFKQDKHITLTPKVEDKLDKLLEQNKMIAEGIIAIGENFQLEFAKPKKQEKKPKKEPEEEKEEDYEESEEPEKEENYDLEPLPEFNF